MAELTANEAIALAQARRGQWCLLGYEMRGKPCPVYSCGNCFLQRYTLVTPGAKLPGACPKCHQPMAEAS